MLPVGLLHPPLVAPPSGASVFCLYTLIVLLLCLLFKMRCFMLSFLSVCKLLEGRDHILVIFGTLEQYHQVLHIASTHKC